MNTRVASILFAAFVLAACGPTKPKGDNNNNNQNVNAGDCVNGTRQCFLNQVQICQGNTWVPSNTCAEPTPICHDGNCVVCQPNVNFCVGKSVYECGPMGTAGNLVTTCGDNEDCVSGTCTSPCRVAEATKSYIGCEYWPTPTVNSGLNGVFSENFGVAVNNANDRVATVVISLGGAEVARQDVGPSSIHLFKLANDTGLKLSRVTLGSVKVPNSAYHLVSTMPVTVYQFNPYDYRLPVRCEGGTFLDPNECFSHSNDASLLLPQHVLSQNYIVMSRQTFGVERAGYISPMLFGPGFLAVVGTEDNTTVNVTYSAHTMAGTGVSASTPGAQVQYTVNRGEVLQVLSAMPSSCTGQSTSDDCNGIGGSCTYCDMGETYDLTGTIISTNAPVAVFSGHDCSFVPYNYWACDHLEEQMMPLETWGKDFVVGRTAPQNQNTHPPEPNVIRILSGNDGNVVTFNPPQALGASVTLQQGEWREFTSTDNFRITGEGALMVAQFLVGQNYYSSGTDAWGDPAYSLVVPTEQFRNEYTFIAPESITYNYVNIIKRTSEGAPPVYLNGSPVSESAFSTPIGGTHFGSASVELPQGGAYSIHSTEPFGITIYGFAQYTSYSYPGGLDLKFINPVD